MILNFLVRLLVIIEKLLRTTDVKRIYALIRAKRGQDMLERLASWKEDGVSSPQYQTRAVGFMLIYSPKGI